MVAEVDQATGLWSERLSCHQARAPIRDDRRIERRLIELVFEKHPPAVGQPRVDFAQKVEVRAEDAIEVRLPGEIGAVGDPDGQRLRPELLADLDALEIVRDRLVAHSPVAVGQRTELVRELLTGLVLKRVGVDRVKADAKRLRLFGKLAVIADLVPREMRRAGRRRPRQLMDGCAILELVDNAARFALARKAGEARAARADPPRRNGDGESGDFGGDRLDVEAAALQAPSEGGIVLILRRGELFVLFADQRMRDAIRHVSSPVSTAPSNSS